MPPQSSVSAIIKFASSSRLASSTASRLCRTHHIRSMRPISQVSRSLLHSSKKVARVGSIPKDRHQCFQALEEGVQNDSVIAMGGIARSTTLESVKADVKWEY